MKKYLSNMKGFITLTLTLCCYTVVLGRQEGQPYKELTSPVELFESYPLPDTSKPHFDALIRAGAGASQMHIIRDYPLITAIAPYWAGAFGIDLMLKDCNWMFARTEVSLANGLYHAAGMDLHIERFDGDHIYYWRDYRSQVVTCSFNQIAFIQIPVYKPRRIKVYGGMGFSASCLLYYKSVWQYTYPKEAAYSRYYHDYGEYGKSAYKWACYFPIKAGIGIGKLRLEGEWLFDPVVDGEIAAFERNTFSISFGYILHSQ